MKIGYDAKRLFFNRTGLGNYSRNLVGGLTQQYPQHEYLLYSPQFAGAVKFHFEKDIIVRIPSGFAATFPAWWRSFGLAKEIEKDQLDIFHGLSHELPFGIEKSKVKSVVTVHDVIFKRFPEQYPSIDRLIYDRKLAYSCKAANRIIAISEQTKHDIITFYGVDPNKIEVIYQGCGPVFMDVPGVEAIKQVKAKYQLPDRYLLYVGSLVERKNVLNLLKAFELVGDKNLSLILVGNGGSYRKKTERYIREKKLGRQISILTGVATEELPVLYRQAQAFVYPSVYEGFGIPIIEALSCDVPVITTQGGCFREAGGPGALYVDTDKPAAIAEAIEQVLIARELRQKMITEGRKYVHHFHPNLVAKQVMKLYETIAD